MYSFVKKWNWNIYSFDNLYASIGKYNNNKSIILVLILSWGCPRGDCVPRSGTGNGEGVADVLLSLKHAVVHPGSPTGGYYASGPPHHYSQDYTQNLGPPVPQSHYGSGPAMSVNVSMNMTMNMNMHPG